MEETDNMTHTHDYPRPALSVDLIVLRPNQAEPEVLLIQRKHEPFANCWALPGGFLDIDETLESAAARELKEETCLNVESLVQIGAYSAVHRDPRGRVISVAFLAELEPDQIPTAADDAKSVGWFSLNSLPELAFDHQLMIDDAIKRESR